MFNECKAEAVPLGFMGAVGLIETVVFGAREPRTGALGGVINVFEESFGFKPRIYGGFMEKECAALLSDFFKNVRK